MFRVVRAGSLGLALLSLVACRAKITPSQHKAEELRPMPDFTAVDVDGAIKVEITVGKPTRLHLIGDNTVIPHIGTKVLNGRLKLSLIPVKNHHRATPTVKIHTPFLDGFTCKGTTDATIKGVKGKHLTVQAGGTSRIVLVGAIDQLDIDASGASSIDATKLKAKNAKVALTGAGKVHVDASTSLDAAVTGAGEVLYAGNPAKVNKKVSGAGRIVAD